MKVKKLIIPFEDFFLHGDLRQPNDAEGLIIFVTGVVGGYTNYNNRFLASTLNQNGFATLHIDLFNEKEINSGKKAYKANPMAHRLLAVADYMGKALPIGYFASGAGAAIVLLASAMDKTSVKAIVCRGGRPTEAIPAIPQINCPVLLLVGSFDQECLMLNEAVYSRLCRLRKMFILDGASHLFQQPGKIEEVAAFAGGWFKEYVVERKPATVDDEILLNS